MKHLLAFIYISILLTPAFSQEKHHLSLALPEKTIINRHIYGHFAEHLGRCIYDGFYRNGKIRMDIVNALNDIKVPNLRWPGGCFADRYHWKDGVGPKKERPARINTTWGMVKEDNSFGTDEFMQLCNLLNCEPYVAGNMGTGSPSEMNDWVEYLNYKGTDGMGNLRLKNGHKDAYGVKYWGVGNESWGCGGNMTPDYYSDLYKHYSSLLVDYPGTKLFKIASGPFNYDMNWTETFMKKVPLDLVNGLSLHYYTIPSQNWNSKGSATRFSEREYFTTMWQALRMDFIISTNEGIMNKYDPEKKVALVVDEWGSWTDPEPGTNPAFLYQQSTLRDALVAGTTLNIFNNHCERVKMANLAQAVNVLQSLILTKEDKMLLTPTYHVFKLYKVHQEAKYIPIQLNSPYWHSGKDSIPSINASASLDKNNKIHISLVNLNPNEETEVEINLPSSYQPEKVSGSMVSSENVSDFNNFDYPNKISVKAFNNATLNNNNLHVKLPAKSVTVIEILQKQ